MFIINCFSQNEGARESTRFVYKDGDKRPDVNRPSEANIPGWVGYSGESEAAEYLKQGRTSVSPLEPLRIAVEARKDTQNIEQPVPPKAKDNLKKRTLEIFGTTEIQEWYIKAISEALEKMNGDDLYEFIKKHNSYQAKNDHVKWNADFAAIFGNLNIPEAFKGKTDPVTHRRITAATQMVLVDHYKNNVFQLDQKIINPWIFIDGRMGPYTVSVLSDYWMAKYGAKSTKTPKPPGRAGVAGEYKPGTPGAKTYDAAMRHLDAQTKKRTEPPKTDKAPEPADADADAKVKKRFAALDKAGDSITMAQLAVEFTPTKNYMTLSKVLAEAYGGENPRDKNGAPKTFRVLNLLAQRIGKEVNVPFQVRKGDTLRITAEGIYTVTAADGKTKRREVNLLGPASSTPPVKPPKEEDTPPPPEESDEEVKSRFASADTAADKIDNPKNLPIIHLLKKQYISLDLALAEAYEGKGAEKAAYVSRVLNLLAQKVGAAVKKIPFAVGDTIEITADGDFKIIKPDASIRYIQPKIF